MQSQGMPMQGFNAGPANQQMYQDPNYLAQQATQLHKQQTGLLGQLLGGGGGGGGGAALTLTLPLAATPDFPAAIASISVSASRVDASLDGTGLPLGSVVCILENVAPVACAQVSTPTGGVAFPHMPLSAFSLAPGTTYAMTRGTSNLGTIASVTLP
jgi:hypothetical protein